MFATRREEGVSEKDLMELFATQVAKNHKIKEEFHANFKRAFLKEFKRIFGGYKLLLKEGIDKIKAKNKNKQPFDINKRDLYPFDPGNPRIKEFEERIKYTIIHSVDKANNLERTPNELQSRKDSQIPTLLGTAMGAYFGIIRTSKYVAQLTREAEEENPGQKTYEEWVLSTLKNIHKLTIELIKLLEQSHALQDKTYKGSPHIKRELLRLAKHKEWYPDQQKVIVKTAELWK